MGKVKAQISVSADGYVAGPNQGREHPLGEGGEALHEWAYELRVFQQMHGREGGVENASTPILQAASQSVGAIVMGRNMFGPIRGEWDESWRGWWGEEPPFRVPVFVLTHHPRASLEMEGGTTFHFVTEGVEGALERARAAAGDQDVAIGGGARTIQQFIRAGLVEELVVSQVPLFLGCGERLFEGIPPQTRLEQVEVIEAPGVAHLFYRLGY